MVRIIHKGTYSIFIDFFGICVFKKKDPTSPVSLSHTSFSLFHLCVCVEDDICFVFMSMSLHNSAYGIENEKIYPILFKIFIFQRLKPSLD